jgi:hypothetical protein
MRRIIQGDRRRFRYTLTDVDTGNLVDASAIQVVANKYEDGTSATYQTSDPEFAQAATGTYDFYTDTLAAGTWSLEFQSDGTYPDRKRIEFQIVAQQS